MGLVSQTHLCGCRKDTNPFLFRPARHHQLQQSVLLITAHHTDLSKCLELSALYPYFLTHNLQIIIYISNIG